MLGENGMDDAADEGVQIYWHIDAILPAMTPRMGAGVVPGVIVFNAMIHGRGGNGVAQSIIRAIGNGSQTIPGSCYATAWSE